MLAIALASKAVDYVRWSITALIDNKNIASSLSKAMDKRRNIAHRQQGRVPQPAQEELYDEVGFELPEYEKSRASQQASQESERPILASTTKQPKKKLTKLLIAVLVIAGVLIALFIFTTFILASIHVHLLKETQGIYDCVYMCANIYTDQLC